MIQSVEQSQQVSRLPGAAPHDVANAFPGQFQSPLCRSTQQEPLAVGLVQRAQTVCRGPPQARTQVFEFEPQSRAVRVCADQETCTQISGTDASSIGTQVSTMTSASSKMVFPQD